MPETIDLPTIDTSMIDGPITLGQLTLKEVTPDLTKIDLTDVALAMYGKWPDEVKAVKANLSTVVLDLSTAAKITEARSLRTRLILNPLAAARKVSAGIKSKMATTSKAVGVELEKIEAAYKEADALILPKIEAREAELEAEREEKQRIERERIEKHQSNIERIRAYAVKADTEPEMTAARVALGIAQLEAMPTPTSEVWQEFAVPAADAICWTLARMRLTHERLLRAEQAEAEAAELRRQLEATAPMREPEAMVLAEPIKAPDEQHAPPQSVTTAEAGTRSAGAPYTPQQGANRDASAEQSHVAEGSTSPTGRGADGPIAGGAAPVSSSAEYTEGRASQQVLKAEPATADATDRDAPAMSSPSVGSMGEGQAADAAPAGGSQHAHIAQVLKPQGYVEPATTLTTTHHAGPITMIEPAAPADPRDAILREALALTKYAAAPFFGKFPTHPKTTPEWWAGLREQIEALQPKLIAHIEGLQ